MCIMSGGPPTFFFCSLFKRAVYSTTVHELGRQGLQKTGVVADTTNG